MLARKASLGDAMSAKLVNTVLRLTQYIWISRALIRGVFDCRADSPRTARDCREHVDQEILTFSGAHLRHMQLKIEARVSADVLERWVNACLDRHSRVLHVRSRLVHRWRELHCRRARERRLSSRSSSTFRQTAHAAGLRSFSMAQPPNRCRTWSRPAHTQPEPLVQFLHQVTVSLRLPNPALSLLRAGAHWRGVQPSSPVRVLPCPHGVHPRRSSRVSAHRAPYPEPACCSRESTQKRPWT